MLQLVLVFTPVTESLYKWLCVTQELPAQPVDCIVCLGGGYERLVWTALAYRIESPLNASHQLPPPRIVVSNAPGAAEFMRYLLNNCGVPERDILIDNHSHTTADHPAGVARLPGMDPRTQRFVIVTDQEHSRRAAAVFRTAGFAHFTIYGGLAEEPGRRRVRWRVQRLPRMVYEYAALLQYWWQGKI